MNKIIAKALELVIWRKVGIRVKFDSLKLGIKEGDGRIGLYFDGSVSANKEEILAKLNPRLL